MAARAGQTPRPTHDTVFVRDMNDVITYWNRGAEELYGWTREEAVGKFTHQLMQTIFPVPLEEVNANYSARAAGRESSSTPSDGTQVVVASRWSLQRDEQGRPTAILETNNDITERKGAEQRLRAAEQETAAHDRHDPGIGLQHDAGWHPGFLQCAGSRRLLGQDLLSDWSAVVHRRICQVFWRSGSGRWPAASP